MKKIGIICASDTELAPFLPHIQSVQSIKKALLDFHTGQIGQTEVVAVYSGVCKVNAAIAAQVLIDSFQVACILNAGTAGGMDERVQLFDTVISDSMMYHDVAEDILTEFHPWLQENCFKADRALLAAARQYSQTASFPILFGTMVTGEQFIKDDKRAEINQHFAPLSVDMETTSIAQVCHANAIPFLSIRTITDTASHSGIENFEANCEAASERAASITMELLKRLAE